MTVLGKPNLTGQGARVLQSILGDGLSCFYQIPHAVALFQGKKASSDKNGDGSHGWSSESLGEEP